MKRVRKLALSGVAPKEVIAELGSIDAEGGQIGRTSILYEVRLLTYWLPEWDEWRDTCSDLVA